MKILVDECAPRALRQFLSQQGYDCLSVQEAEWSGKQNGELLQLADSQFDVLVTLDTNLQHQQNLRGRKIAIVVIRAGSNRLPDLRPHFETCASVLLKIGPGDVAFVA